jgi:hypothetical protein
VESSVKTGERVGTTGADTKIRVSISTSTRRKNVIIVAAVTTVGTTVMSIAITATITGSKPDKLDGNSLPLCVKAESRLFPYEHQPTLHAAATHFFTSPMGDAHPPKKGSVAGIASPAIIHPLV